MKRSFVAGCDQRAAPGIELKIASFLRTRSYSSVLSAGVLTGGGALLGGPLESLPAPNVAVSPTWLAPAAFGVATFPAAAAPGAASPSGPQEEADWAEDEGLEGGCTLGGTRRLLSKCRLDNCGPKHTHTDSGLRSTGTAKCVHLAEHCCQNRLDLLTELLLAGISVELELAEVVGVLLAGPRSSQPLVHVQLLQLLRHHVFPHTKEAVSGHFGKGAVLPEAARLQGQNPLFLQLKVNELEDYFILQIMVKAQTIFATQEPQKNY